jgi:Transglycosylase SLT domain
MRLPLATAALVFLPVTGFQPGEAVFRPAIPRPSSLEESIVRASLAANLPPHLALNLAWRESRMNPRAIHCCNRDGSADFGIFQLNSRTVHIFSAADPHFDPLDANQNLRAAIPLFAAYFRAGGASFAVCAWRLGPDRCRSSR